MEPRRLPASEWLSKHQVKSLVGNKLALLWFIGAWAINLVLFYNCNVALALNLG